MVSWMLAEDGFITDSSSCHQRVSFSLGSLSPHCHGAARRASGDTCTQDRFVTGTGSHPRSEQLSRSDTQSALSLPILQGGHRVGLPRPVPLEMALERVRAKAGSTSAANTRRIVRGPWRTVSRHTRVLRPLRLRRWGGGQWAKVGGRRGGRSRSSAGVRSEWGGKPSNGFQQ